MKKFRVFGIVFFGLSNALHAQSMPEFMLKALCEKTPNIEICPLRGKSPAPTATSPTPTLASPTPTTTSPVAPTTVPAQISAAPALSATTQTRQPNVHPTQGSASPSTSASVPAKKAETAAIAVEPFNLKGLNLRASKAEVQKLVPALKFSALNGGDLVEGKVAGAFVCGPKLQNTGGACNFTYAGIPIHHMYIDYWGETAISIQLLFSDYTNIKDSSTNSRTAMELKAALDEKYGVQQTSSSLKGSWKSGAETLSIEDVEEGSIKSNSIYLTNFKTRGRYIDALSAQGEAREKVEQRRKMDKKKSDM